MHFQFVGALQDTCSLSALPTFFPCSASFLLDELWARASSGHKLSFWEDLMANGLQDPCDLCCRLLLFSLRRGLLPLEENEPVRHCSCFFHIRFLLHRHF